MQDTSSQGKPGVSTVPLLQRHNLSYLWNNTQLTHISLPVLVLHLSGAQTDQHYTEYLFLNLHRRPALPNVFASSEFVSLLVSSLMMITWVQSLTQIKHQRSALSWFAPQSTLPTPPASQSEVLLCSLCPLIKPTIFTAAARISAGENWALHHETGCRFKLKAPKRVYELATYFAWKIHVIACFCLLNLVEPIYNCVYVPLSPLSQFPEGIVASSEREHGAPADSLCMMKMRVTHTRSQTVWNKSPFHLLKSAEVFQYFSCSFVNFTSLCADIRWNLHNTQCDVQTVFLRWW